MVRLICLGHGTIDLIYRVGAIPERPTKIVARAFTESGGGMAANASVAAARLGARVHYWGRVGNDALGDQIIALLRTEGVHTDGVRRIDGARSPCTAVMVDERGERLICTYDDPALDEDASWLPLALLATTDVMLADVRWPAGTARAFAAARKARIPSVLDADVAPVDILRDLARACDYAVFSEDGLRLASGATTAGEGLQRMQQLVHGTVGVTLGPDGFLWLEGGRERRARPPHVIAVDTLAAGDVFHAAFALAIGEGRALAEAAAFANAAAALKCARFGGRLGAPRRSEVEAVLREAREQ